MAQNRSNFADAYRKIYEKLKPSDGAGAYIDDFRKSDAPQFKGKSDKKIQKMAVAAYLDDKDKAKKEEIDTKNQSEQLVFQTEKQMKDLDDKLSDDDRNDLNDALEKLKKANESSVVEDIKSEMENLNSVWSSKASSMYDASNANAQEPSPQEAESVSKEKDDKKIKEADFEVVED